MSVINNEKCVMLFTYGINLIKKGDIPILGVNAINNYKAIFEVLLSCLRHVLKNQCCCEGISLYWYINNRQIHSHE